MVKPDPASFQLGLDRLGLTAAYVLMVGDRSGWDGADVEQGLTTLLLPPLTDPAECRLGRVQDLVLPDGSSRRTCLAVETGD